jgi:hypothetical protein
VGVVLQPATAGRLHREWAYKQEEITLDFHIYIYLVLENKVA